MPRVKLPPGSLPDPAVLSDLGVVHLFGLTEGAGVLTRDMAARRSDTVKLPAVWTPTPYGPGHAFTDAANEWTDGGVSAVTTGPLTLFLLSKATGNNGSGRYGVSVSVV